VDALSALLSIGLGLFTIVGFELLHHTSFFADATMEIKSCTLTEAGEIILN
jgi:hypothetical protein